jgi:predicted metal-binding membrane protein
MTQAHVHEGGRQAALRLPVKQMAPAWGALVLLAIIGWIVTVQQAQGMGIGPGPMGLAPPAFIFLWVVMMAAMMFPSVAPIAIMWSRTIVARSTGARRAWRIGSFVCGYLIAWAGFGVIAYLALVATEWLVEESPDVAHWLGVAIFVVAGVYQLTPLKDACLRHCRTPMASLLHYANFKGAARDLRVGLHHGVYCVGCCWGLMLVLVAVGVMNVPAMIALAVVIFLEKLWSRGWVLTRVVAVVFIAIAVLAAFDPSLLPALRPAAGMGGMTDEQPADGMAPEPADMGAM